MAATECSAAVITYFILFYIVFWSLHKIGDTPSDKISNLFTKIFLNFENCITTVKNNDKFQLNSLGLKSEYFNNWLSCEFLNEAFDKEHQFAFLISNDSVRMSIAKKSKIFLTVYDFYAEEDKLRNFAKNFSKELH